MHNQKITVGSLQVQVVECTRLPVVEHASEVFCTVNVGKLEGTSLAAPLEQHAWLGEVGLDVC